MTDMMRPLVAAGLFVAALAGCSAAEIPAPPSEPAVEVEPLVSLRCEVDWRCYAIDPDTGRRAGLLRSDTAYAEGNAADFGESRLCFFAQREAERVRCREGSPYFEQLEIDRGCSCSRERLEGGG